MSFDAYVAEIKHLAGMPSERAGHCETEHLSAGRCMTCGLRGHTHFDCPGVQPFVPEPVRHYEWDGLTSVRRRSRGIK